MILQNSQWRSFNSFDETRRQDKQASVKNERKEISPEEYKEPYVTGSQPGILYGLRKIHKPNVPLRPILSSIGTAGYGLSKFFVPLLKPLTFNQ